MYIPTKNDTIKCYAVFLKIGFKIKTEKNHRVRATHKSLFEFSLNKMEKLGVHRDALQPMSVRGFLESWDPSAIPGMDRGSVDNEKAMLQTFSSEMGIPVDTLQELNIVCG